MLNATINGAQNYQVELKSNQTLINEEEFSYDLVTVSSNRFHIIAQHQSYNVEVIKADHRTKEYLLKINGMQYAVQLQDRFDQLIQALGMQEEEVQADKKVQAPMPGLVLQIHVEEGATVAKGSPLVTLEAMKMENVIKATAEGTVKAVHARIGQSVEKNYLLLELH